jgi:hypothetical protein
MATFAVSHLEKCVVHLQDKVTPSTEGIVAWRVISKQTVALCFGYAKTLLTS